MKTALAAFLAIALSASAANAAKNCNTNFDEFWEKMRQYGNAKLSTDAIVGINRQAIRAFDACQAGDAFTADSFFDKLRQNGEIKSVWEEIQAQQAKGK
ncbi:MAG: hypothetical protein NW217_06060 [Hyphomicrobiaceae bacterium]|nr:hypothetical protein [Hyphomicrobiaceae bacterium]